MTACKTCDTPLSRYNKSGYCKRHVSAALAASPEWREKQRTGAIRALRGDPGRLQLLREHALKNTRAGKGVEKLRAYAIANRIWEKGHAALRANPEAHKVAGRRGSATKLAWCPAELRDEYRRLVYSLRYSAADARRMILDQHEADMRRFRAKLGVVAAPAWSPPNVRDMAPFDRAVVVAADFADVTVEDILGDTRARHVTLARFVVMVALRRAGWSMPAIGEELGYADHSGVAYGLGQAQALLTTDADFASACDAAWPSGQVEAAA